MDGKNILVDIGVTNKNILISLEKININPKDIDVIFITHEHIDHVRGLKVFLKNNSPIVYMNKKTYNELDFEIENIAFVEENFQIDKLNVEIVKTSHDAIDSFGIIFNGKNGKFVHITDTGYINGKVVKNSLHILLILFYTIASIGVCKYISVYFSKIIQAKYFSNNFLNKSVMCFDGDVSVKRSIVSFCFSNYKYIKKIFCLKWR